MAPARVLPSVGSAKASPRQQARAPKNKEERRQGARAKKDANVLQGLDIDEEHLDTVLEQILQALAAKRVRVMEVFRQFDDDGSGHISRREFIKAMRELGLDAADD